MAYLKWGSDLIKGTLNILRCGCTENWGACCRKRIACVFPYAIILCIIWWGVATSYYKARGQGQNPPVTQGTDPKKAQWGGFKARSWQSIRRLLSSYLTEKRAWAQRSRMSHMGALQQNEAAPESLSRSRGQWRAGRRRADQQAVRAASLPGRATGLLQRGGSGAQSHREGGSLAPEDQPSSSLVERAQLLFTAGGASSTPAHC